jgi:hypothetical protein
MQGIVDQQDTLLQQNTANSTALQERLAAAEVGVGTRCGIAIFSVLLRTELPACCEVQDALHDRALSCVSLCMWSASPTLPGHIVLCASLQTHPTCDRHVQTQMRPSQSVCLAAG